MPNRPARWSTAARAARQHPVYLWHPEMTPERADEILEKASDGAIAKDTPVREAGSTALA